MRIAVFPVLPHLEAAAVALAQQLSLPLAASQQEPYDYFLVMTPDYLGLQKKASTSAPLYVDFLHGKMNYRAQHTSLRNEALAKAMGLKGNVRPHIVDATGGLAGDAFTLASLGFDVILLERSAIIFALVAEGVQRAQTNPGVAASLSRIQRVHADAITWLQGLKASDRPDIIYLDPMFPERKKSALPKQEMLILHDIVGEDADAELLLKTALTCAKKRVVVKRSRLAARLIIDPAPSFSVLGSSSRFDVYLTGVC